LDEKFKKQVLNEIPNEVDLKLTTRSYVESLSNIHTEIRKQIASSVNQSRRIIDDAFRHFPKEDDQEVNLLQVLQVDGKEVVKSDSLFLENDDIRKKLEGRNAKLSNLHLRFATNR